MALTLREFCERAVYLKGKPITFSGRGYLEEPYSSVAKRLVLRCSRQVEKTTFVVNRILHRAVTYPGIQQLLVLPRREQASTFMSSRLVPAVMESPLIRRVLHGSSKRRPPVNNWRFSNGSQLFVRPAFHTADAVRGISADSLLVDEFQDISSGDLAVLEETLSHSELREICLTGTPKLCSNHLETAYSQSTAKEWLIPCPDCQRLTRLDERVLYEDGIRCPECEEPLDPRLGKWVAQNPTSRWGDGFWFNHLLAPWHNYDEILARQAAYPTARFRSECLGLPCSLGDHVISRPEIEDCCGNLPMAQTLADVPAEGRERLIAGIDWGGGVASATVLVLGYMRPNLHCVIVSLERFRPDEQPNRVLRELAARCDSFRVKYIAADGGGNGNVYNRLLQDQLGYKVPLYGIIYSTVDQDPTREGTLFKWTINRTASIGNTFSRIKKQLIHFPSVQACGTFIDEFTCELAEYDDYERSIRYTRPEQLPDDALHATVYLQQLGLRMVHYERHPNY